MCGLNLAGYGYIRKHDVFNLSEVQNRRIDCVNDDVFQKDVVNQRLFDSRNGNGLVGPFTNIHILDVDVAKLCREVAASVAVIVVSQSQNPGFTNIEVLYIDILYEPAPVEIGLAVQDVPVFVVAVIHENVPNTTGTLAADCDAVEVRRHIADNNILARSTGSPSAIVPAGLDGQAVVALVQVTVFDQDVRAGIRINSVIVRVMADNLQFSDGNICAKCRVHTPERIIVQRHAFYQNIGALEGFNHRWFSVDPYVFHGDIVVVQFA